MNFIRLIFILFGIGLVLIEYLYQRRKGGSFRLTKSVLAVISGLSMLLLIYLWLNHLRFPLHLDLMEGVVWQHFQRAASFTSVYPAPTPEYVPLAYNPLLYWLAIPFSWVFGVNIVTLRMVAILGTIGSGVILYLVIMRETSSRWWSLITVGLFASAYMVMDAYLDTAHSDSWLLFFSLLGTYLIYLNRSKAVSLLGVVVLVLAFWFKQHGAVFAIGGLIYLTWQDGFRKSLIYWFIAVLLGPIIYIFLGQPIFGEYFHFFTWTVPRNWTEFNFGTVRHYLGFILKSYPILALSGGLLVLWQYIWDRKHLNIWHVQFIFALLTGFMGSLDPGSSNNVFIPMGTWFILVGSLGLYRFSTASKTSRKYGLFYVAIFLTLALFIYNPRNVIISSQAKARYQDLISLLRNLDGPVYALTLGQLDKDFVLYPAAHWVALEDMIRGPGKDTSNHPNTRQLLNPVINPIGKAYILANWPLEVYPWMAFLADYYVLETDYGERFIELRSLPKRFDHGWPRYLYRYDPAQAKNQGTQ